MNYLLVFSKFKCNHCFNSFTLVCIAFFFHVTVSASSLPLVFSPDTYRGNMITNINYQDTLLKNYDTPPSYPGGSEVWMMYLMKNLRYPPDALKKKIVGQVVVRFSINEKGRPNNVKAISGPRELQQEAVRLIKNGGKWNPATLKGNPVVSQKEQAVTFVFHS